MIWQYRLLEPEETIVIGADPAEGGDYSSFVAISRKYSDVVLVGKSKEESSQLGHTLNHVGKFIKNQTGTFPSIAVERNVGSACIYVLKELNYPNLFKMPNSFTQTTQVESDNYGWSTNMATRPKMLDDLALAIRQQVIKIPSKQIVDELYSFIRHAKTGKPQADNGSNDDLVMALAIAWQVNEVGTISVADMSQYDNINQGLHQKWRI